MTLENDILRAPSLLERRAHGLDLRSAAAPGECKVVGGPLARSRRHSAAALPARHCFLHQCSSTAKDLRNLGRRGAGRHGGQKAIGTWSSQVVPHQSTTQAFGRLTSEFGWDSVWRAEHYHLNEKLK